MEEIDLAQRIATILERKRPQLQPLHGGMVGEVYLARWPDDQVVVKVDRREAPQLAIEGLMLAYLAQESTLPVPDLQFVADDLLVMEYLPGSSRFTIGAEQHAAQLLADLHTRTAPAFGFEIDTLIGLFPQPNPWTDSWIAFFGEHRLTYLARLARDRGAMPAQLQHRVESLVGRLGDLLEEPAMPALIHGDIWSANLLADGEFITGCLDPALYYAHPEVELAYIALFNSLGETFFERYHELAPIRPGFFEQRMLVYQIYPLLSHVCHFGGHYVKSTADMLARLGF